MNTETLITFENFNEFLNKEVYVGIYGKWGGMLYPERNILIGMNKVTYYFKGFDNDDETINYWDCPTKEEDGWSCEVLSITKPAPPSPEPPANPRSRYESFVEEYFDLEGMKEEEQVATSYGNLVGLVCMAVEKLYEPQQHTVEGGSDIISETQLKLIGLSCAADECEEKENFFYKRANEICWELIHKLMGKNKPDTTNLSQPKKESKFCECDGDDGTHTPVGKVCKVCKKIIYEEHY